MGHKYIVCKHQELFNQLSYKALEKIPTSLKGKLDNLHLQGRLDEFITVKYWQKVQLICAQYKKLREYQGFYSVINLPKVSILVCKYPCKTQKGTITDTSKPYGVDNINAKYQQHKPKS